MLWQWGRRNLKLAHKYVIHASNIHGIGAIQVVESIIKAIQRIDSKRSYICYCPQSLLNNLQHNAENFDFRSYRRYLPNVVSRFCESVFSPIFFERTNGFIVLGDIPLRIRAKQIVLVHQPNLLSPAVNPFTTKSFKYCVLRKIFALNVKYATHFVVQTNAMAEALIQSYPAMKGKVSVAPQPPPEWFDKTQIKSRGGRRIESGKRLVLFYPAAYYPHKNHKIFSQMQPFENELSKALDKIFLTVSKDEMGFEAPWVKTLGILPSSKVIEFYRKSDALIFPSLLESYGLPLVEAMAAGLPVLCSNLPYAKWLCEDQAIYFDPLNPESVIAAIVELHGRLQLGWSPDWSVALRKLPKSWDEVAAHFLKLVA